MTGRRRLLGADASATGHRGGPEQDRQARRLLWAFLGLAVVWAVAFNATGLPFFPLVVAGGILTGLVGLWVRRADGRRALPTLRVGWRTGLLALGVGVVHYVVGMALFEIGSAILPAFTATALEVYERSSGLPLWAQVLLGAGVTAAMEEVFWRGAFTPIVAERVEQRLPERLGTVQRSAVLVVVSTVGYTLFHVATLKVVLVAAAALGGLVWGALLLATRSVGAAIIAHVVWTALMILFPPAT